MADHPEHPVFTPARGQRLHWSELPDQVQQALEERLGAHVVEAATQPGGFSPGLAARLSLADGHRVFVTPRFLVSYDDGNWIALVFEDIDGTTPRTPWQQDELDRVLLKRRTSWA